MSSKHKLAGTLTPNQLEVLLALDKSGSPDRTMREIGACKYSHHYATVYSLVKKNLIEKKEDSDKASSKYVYALTSVGKEALQFTKTLLDVFPASVMGPSTVRNRLVQAQALVQTFELENT